MKAARTHKNSRLKEYKNELRRYAESQRLSAAERGYNSAWYRMTKSFRKEHPLCAYCLAKGLIVAGTVVDHIIPHKGDYKLFANPKNWQRLCTSCHSIKTNKEDGGFGNPIRS